MSRAKCSICSHSEAAAINAAVEVGLFQRDVAVQFNVSKYALSRHKKNCLAPVPIGNGESSTGDQLEKWLRRADDLYIQAGVNGDVRSQVSALSAAVRSLQSAQRHEARCAEQDEKPSAGQMEVDRLDRIVEQYLESCGSDRCWRCGAPCANGVYNGPAQPGTFPDLISQSEPTEPN
jgi:hypothetical protein